MPPDDEILQQDASVMMPSSSHEEEEQLSNNVFEQPSLTDSSNKLQPVQYATRKREHVHTVIFESSVKASIAVAEEIASLIQTKQQQGECCVLGLATGSTPLSLYAELIRMHQEDGLSFHNVVTFNLDEYYPMEPKSIHSYVRFMNENLFDHVNIPSENIHIPNGTIEKKDIAKYCMEYEQKIQEYGGIDIQILGIGRTGHIGFNEPGSTRDGTTRLVGLHRVTRVDAASDFFALENVPRQALTMGIGTILTHAKRILLLAWGESKARNIQRAVEGDVVNEIPATFLQHHSNTSFVLDEASSTELCRIKSPWLLDSTMTDIWKDEKMVKKAIIWLGLHLQKPILKLTDRDYMDHGMGGLLLQLDDDIGETPTSAYDWNLKVFYQLQHLITGWPGGGKPNDMSRATRPERAEPATKRIIIFSPHPDDDVISMGGTFDRLVHQGHEVHVAYQTSGSIAVHDEDAIRFADFYSQMLQHHPPTGGNIREAKDGTSLYTQVKQSIQNKKPGDVDTPQVLHIKSMIRMTEARAAARFVGVPDERMHFLNLPFYETGKVKKKPLGETDIEIVMDLIRAVKPHQIYAAGDLSDPHGTHRVCLSAIFEACKRLKEQQEECIQDCWVWLFRGAWQEYPIEEMGMAVPLSPREVLRKRQAIFKHESQKDTALFPGNDPREFWQRAEARNRTTAQLFDTLGLPEYEAMEAFQRYRF